MPMIMSDEIHIVDADVGSGTGGGISNGQVGNWYHSYGSSVGDRTTSEAWDNFVRVQKRDLSTLKSIFEERLSGQGGWGGMSLYNSCRKSQFIWWYGYSDSRDWATWIGRNVHPTKSQMKSISHPESHRALDKFFSYPYSVTGWDRRGGTVIICSGSFMEEDPPVKITVTGDTKYFLYNGKQHVVNTWKRTSGTLKSGHSIRATAYGARTSVGNSPVTVSNVSVRSGDTNVSSQYDITTKNGRIYVRAVPSGNNERCETITTEKVKQIVQSDVNVAHGFRPSGSPTFSAVKKINRNNAYSLSRGAQLPQVGDSRSSWNTWKSNFANGAKDISTPAIDLEKEGIAQIIAKHGGVLNITRTHHHREVSATICQPQKRDAYIDSNGNAKWGSWYDVGKPELKSVSAKNAGQTHYSYQILGVNCNAPGFQRALNSNDINHSYGDGKASGLLETKEKSGLDFPLGRSGHETGTHGFYNDGPSCQDAFKNACVSTKLTASAKNDANNNLQTNPLFTHEDENEYKDNSPKGHGYPNDDGELVFFRDNKDRTVRADVWYPKDTGVSSLKTDPNEPAAKTIVRLFEGGTPDIDITTIEELDINGNQVPKSNPIKLINKDIELKEKHVNKFNMKSQWASDKGKPYELGVRWVYKADAVNNMPSRLNGSKLLNKGTYTATPFDVHCQFMNEKGSYAAQVPRNPFIKTTIDGNFDWDKDNAIRALFTRSVSDKREETDWNR